MLLLALHVLANKKEVLGTLFLVLCSFYPD
jgi:hypothetical protein